MGVFFGACFLGALAGLLAIAFFLVALDFAATVFLAAFFANFFLGVIFRLASFFAGFIFLFLPVVFCVRACFFLIFFLAAIGAVYHRYGLQVVEGGICCVSEVELAFATNTPAQAELGRGNLGDLGKEN